MVTLLTVVATSCWG